MTGIPAIREAIRRELKADGCTQRDLARYLGISQSHVSKTLAGQRDGGGLPLIEAMAAAVGIGPDQIRQLYTGGTR